MDGIPRVQTTLIYSLQPGMLGKKLFIFLVCIDNLIHAFTWKKSYGLVSSLRQVTKYKNKWGNAAVLHYQLTAYVRTPVLTTRRPRIYHCTAEAAWDPGWPSGRTLLTARKRPRSPIRVGVGGVRKSPEAPGQWQFLNLNTYRRQRGCANGCHTTGSEASPPAPERGRGPSCLRETLGAGREGRTAVPASPAP